MCEASSAEQKKERIPFLLKTWGNLYRAAPKLYIPATQFDIGFALISALFIACIRFTYRGVYQNVFNFDPANPRTDEISACSTSATHSLLLVPSLWAALRDQPYKPSASISDRPQYYQNAVSALLQFCTGYMMYDFIFMLDFEGESWIHPEDIAFAGHHFVTTLYMSQTRVLGAGHISAMTLMWSGEFTNPLQNGYNIVKFAIQMAEEGTFWHVIHPTLELVYAAFYFVFRAFVGPAQIVHISYDLLTKEGRKNVPLKVSVLWIIMIWGIILGSIPWVAESMEMVKDGLVVKYHKDYDYGPRFEI